MALRCNGCGYPESHTGGCSRCQERNKEVLEKAILELRVEVVQDKELPEGGWDGYNGYTRCS